MSKTQSNKIKNHFFLLFIIILLIFISLFFYLKPDHSETSLSNIDSNSINKTSPIQNTSVQEVTHQPEIQLDEKQLTTVKEEVLYDTKSDLSIQPIDPENDPANKVDNN